ncbi:outer membrane receptor protein involved in Fe transport [Chitinophaga dinghuensis]|uniref:Outer membrane receptor protein involved in Fe transport n=1 Tax=Chitinophaga dinghuensis TaxID=1539050 RepID=A0A327VPD7_9BACT|nr:outer membrane beta-barrel family protein [Chitinophaga dinghuensis]RAJ75703.1 outer membrane receptor protein involved in Fe transport [Chitinophaga dinghuensis]
MKKSIFLLPIFSLFSFTMQAQSILGKVNDEKGTPLTGATVALLKVKDSSLVKLGLTQDGGFTFQDAPQDSLFVMISYIGFEKTNSSAFYFSGKTIHLPTLQLRPGSNNLKGVGITARKPMVEVKPDKTVLNVEGTINATGSDALELLRKSPGVVVDKDDHLTLNGKNGVMIYIDGRPSPLSAQDLSNYLKTLSSAQIEAIEMISNPSVQFEAAGTAGIINIRLRKNKSTGWNGSVSAGTSISRNARTDEGFSINYRNEKLNAFGSYNAAFGSTDMDFNLYRTVKDTAFDQKSAIRFNNRSHSFKTGLDYSLSNQQSIGLLVNGSFTSPTLDNHSYTPIIYAPTGNVVRVLDANNNDEMKNNNININGNYAYKDSAGRTLIVNADYGYYTLNSTQWQPNTYLQPQEKTIMSTQNYLIESPTHIDIYSLKADYEQQLGKGRLGIGGKFGYVKTDNTFNQYIDANGKMTFDEAASNFFRYKENVNALYAKYSLDFKGFSLQGGVRAENTEVKGALTGNTKMENEAQSFQKSYLDFFPNVAVTLAPKTNNQFVLGYSRRIDRPVYKDLNPFEYRINEYTFHKGSTDIRPQYSNTISLTHTYKFRLNTTLSYSHVKDVFGQVVDTADGVKGYLSNRNLAAQDITSLNISYPFQYKQYSLFANVNSYYSKYSASYGEGRDLRLDQYGANIFLQNSMRFGKGWTGEASVFYTTPSIWQGSMKAAAMWSADAGVQKQLLQGKATVKLAVSDLFNTLKWSANSDFAGQKIWVSGKQETRQFKVSFTYRFGNSQVKAAKQVQSGTEEENKRVQSNGLGN